MKSFAFLVLAYNHELFIIDHLESIKFQILTYGKGLEIDLIINDDCSKDKTIEFIDSWLKLNSQLFRHIGKFFNSKNIGTAKSSSQMISSLKTDMFKLTAGDDLYSCENIFEAANLFDDKTAFVSGFPLYLKNDDLFVNKISGFLHYSTEILYAKAPLNFRFQRMSYHNAPNLFYNLHCTRNKDVLKYLENYDVIEDWPLQLAISRNYPSFKFKYTQKTFVYYRRTSGSIFLIENKRYFADKSQIYNDLLKNCDNHYHHLLVQIRMMCFRYNKIKFIRVFNLEIWLFVIKSLKYIFPIYLDLSTSMNGLAKHKSHLKLINDNSQKFYNSMRFSK